MKIILNGKITESEGVHFGHQNRAFRYGDACFESIRLINGKPVFWKLHAERVRTTLEFLQMDLQVSDQELRSQILQLAKVNAVEQGGRARIIAWRGGAGKYSPVSSNAEYMIELVPHEMNLFQLNEKGLTVDLFEQMPINPPPLSNFKTNNAIPYVLGSKWKLDKGLDDVIMLDHKGFVAEASSSNLFVFTGKKLITPDVSNGGLKGTMRRMILRLAAENGYEVEEALILPEDLNSAKEVFTTNAIHGLQWVGAYRSNRYYHKESSKLIGILNELATSLS